MTIENQYQILNPQTEDDYAQIMITRNSDYEGVVFKYGTISFQEESNTDGAATLNFQYDVVSNPDEVDTESEEFQTLVGDILVNIIERRIQEESSQQHGNGPDHTIEPDEQ